MKQTKNGHYAIVDPYRRKLTLKYQGQTIVESEKALILKEVGKSVYDPVFYFPKEDIRVALVEEAERKSFCPIKGDASYWNFKDNPGQDYLAWSYEEALPYTKKIKAYIAFNIQDMTLVSEPLK